MPRCFVIQPFNDELDRLYDRVFAPAIRRAGLEPYRVDQYPASNLPVENIEKGIRDSDACLADISSDNPNIWYELGYAVSCGKDVVLVCSSERPTPLPVAVQQRNVFRYCIEAEKDYSELHDAIVSRLREHTLRRERMAELAEGHDGVGGLSAEETAAMLSIASNRLASDATVHPRQVRHDMNAAGFRELAMAIAMEGLLEKQLVREVAEQDARGNRYTAYQLTDDGAGWLQHHRDELNLRHRAA